MDRALWMDAGMDGNPRILDGREFAADSGSDRFGYAVVGRLGSRVPVDRLDGVYDLVLLGLHAK